MSQSIVLQVGQCGNQIGSRFWDLVLQEHAAYNKQCVYDEAISSFFRHVDSKRGRQMLPLGDGTAPLVELKARGIMVDMEEGVISQAMKSPLRALFDDTQLITDVSGSGNNWAVGHMEYGPMFRDRIYNATRRQAEYCDSLQSFFLVHSMGGGTGSGLGTYICDMLHEEFPEVYQFAAVVTPSNDDDVVTSPYNNMLALNKLLECSDCVLPIENQALFDICSKITTGPKSRPSTVKKAGSAISDNGDTAFGGMVTGKRPTQPFDQMNNIVANLLLNMTSSVRFEGSLNVDINDIVTNLVPFPRLKFLVSSMTPLYAYADVRLAPRGIDEMFTDAFSRENQLIKADPKSSTYLACALSVRGSADLSDVRRNIDKSPSRNDLRSAQVSQFIGNRLMGTLKFARWNQEGWKTGLCAFPPVNQPHNLTTLANNCVINSSFVRMRQRFMKLYSRKANLHHYTKYVEPAVFKDALVAVNELIADYARHDHSKAP